jgi:RNA polymerase sigma factor for flagellar operon FliA
VADRDGRDDRPDDWSEQFLAGHQHLVRYVVDRLRASIPGVFDHDDAMQAGMLGLFRARDAYRPDRGATFETYAILRIRGAILDAVRALDPLGRPGREGARTLAAATAELTTTLGREPSDAELAARVGLSVERCIDLRRAASVTMVSLDGQSSTASQDRVEGPGDRVADPQAVDPVDRAALREELTALVREVALLNDRNRRVIALYYRDELTFREIAGVLGVSESRACQIHRSALDGLREALSPPLPVLTPS